MEKLNYLGRLICWERLQRNWSQEGLCQGICAVSYLSKIESGKAEASETVLSLLLARLGFDYSAKIEVEAEELVEKAYEGLFSGDYRELRELINEEKAKHMRSTLWGLDIELLSRFSLNRRRAMDSEYEKCMDNRSLALQRMLQGRSEEAILLIPNAYTYYEAGASAYSKGDYMGAMEYLQRAYELASVDGSAKLMLLCKLFMGGCCCNRHEIEGMERHYSVARRLAHALGDSDALEQMEYNTAAIAIERGDYESSYAYFSNLTKPNMMSLHKLAICCEKTGRKDEALTALAKAEKMECDYPPSELAINMCRLVRYRVDDENYLKNKEYGEALLKVFERCRRELSMGYAIFHLPWVMEWYKASRQYKKALELMEEFPENRHLT